jgi:large subunit ribosomal protein L30
MAQLSDSIRVKLIKSGIGRLPRQRRVLKGLNLTRVNRTVTLKDTREVRGMIEKVAHLVEIIEE